MMKKLIYNRYGDVDELNLVDADIPAVTATTVLIKVKAVSINPLDWKIFRGEMKLMSGSKFPKGVGIEAAALPVVGFAALQIVELASIQPGTELLINGASGGIGMLLIQLARTKGAIVTAAVGEKALALAKKWGSDHVIDYRKENVLENKKQYDVVVDLSGKMPFAKAKNILKPSSVYVNTIPGPREIITSFLHNLFARKKYKVLLSRSSPKALETLADKAVKGMEVLISKKYPLDAFKAAYTELPTQGVLGKAVFVVS